ncbi:uncharacterized protein AMSG_05415 [Thecamonas trahens ATCC 50062]|uniref:UDENN domain-containing protein n=1 Tax=Thecamonas trahens ATCC 50062 TaxID=461836 RepID=A0A0L0DBC0_THETB|nr:hypothetical protein AMSG_05415 [Thecamonas trahens ATCC 50062]KNC49411.1 hypothetical protein AMSG_05415 [Thecamonas trahens ATCC 50062]|eukprot:XP_013757835.1 hypothetical protein AMSG_05415 [Thecamonas trahens ATCC 50062]
MVAVASVEKADESAVRSEAIDSVDSIQCGGSPSLAPSLRRKLRCRISFCKRVAEAAFLAVTNPAHWSEPTVHTLAPHSPRWTGTAKAAAAFCFADTADTALACLAPRARHSASPSAARSQLQMQPAAPTGLAAPGADASAAGTGSTSLWTRLHGFVFVLTTGDGDRLYGHVRRFAGPSDTVYAVCMLSYHPTVALFRKVLKLAERVKGHAAPSAGNCPALGSLFDQVLAARITSPSLKLTVGSSSYTLRLPRATPGAAPRFEPSVGARLALLAALDADAIAGVLLALATERRILVTAQALATLSSSILTLNALLDPLQWQHVFIPVLPPSLFDYACAPMPWLMGVPTSELETIAKYPLDDVVVVYLDHSSVVDTAAERAERASTSSFGDDLAAAGGVALPNKPAAALRKTWSALRKELDAVVPESAQRELANRVSNAFMAFWVSLLGPFRSCLFVDESAVSTGRHASSAVVFDSEALIAQHEESKSTVAFLRALQRTQMFEEFGREIADRAASRRPPNAFEIAAFSYKRVSRSKLGKVFSALRRGGGSSTSAPGSPADSPATPRTPTGTGGGVGGSLGSGGGLFGELASPVLAPNRVTRRVRLDNRVNWDGVDFADIHASFAPPDAPDAPDPALVSPAQPHPEAEPLATSAPLIDFAASTEPVAEPKPELPKPARPQAAADPFAIFGSELAAAPALAAASAAAPTTVPAATADPFAMFAAGPSVSGSLVQDTPSLLSMFDPLHNGDSGSATKPGAAANADVLASSGASTPSLLD